MYQFNDPFPGFWISLKNFLHFHRLCDMILTAEFPKGKHFLAPWSSG